MLKANAWLDDCKEYGVDYEFEGTLEDDFWGTEHEQQSNALDSCLCRLEKELQVIHKEREQLEGDDEIPTGRFEEMLYLEDLVENLQNAINNF